MRGFDDQLRDELFSPFMLLVSDLAVIRCCFVICVNNYMSHISLNTVLLM
jgi:hypothetical protein